MWIFRGRVPGVRLFASLAFALGAISANAADGVAALGAATASATQSVGSISLPVTRTGGSAGAAQIHFHTNGITALAGTNYVGQIGLVKWAAGDAGTKSIKVVFHLTNQLFYIIKSALWHPL